jgi:hypothetical protein
MSWYANSLFPTVEGVFHEVPPTKLPSDPKVAAEKIRSAGYPREAAYVEGLSLADLRNVYEYSGLVSREREAEEEAWAVAEAEWCGR